MAIRSISANHAPEQKTLSTSDINTGENPVRCRIVQSLLAVGVLGLAVVSTGCSMSSGVCRSMGKSHCIDDFMIGYRNRTLAQKAWICNKDHFCNKRFANEFKDGFIQGYSDVASGGNGCMPSVAPAQYWGWRYQSSQGQQAINSYFEGYPLGVQAAEEDGVGNWQTISPMRGLAPTPPPALTPTNMGRNRSDVANPFYAQEEFVPAPVGDDATDDEPEAPTDTDGDSDEEAEEMIGEDAETVFKSFSDDMPVAVGLTDEPELISQLDATQNHEAAVEKMDDETASTEVADVVIDEIFGSADPSPSETVTDGLPFSFE